MNILRNIKNLFIHIRSSLKLIFLIIIAAIIIISIVSLFYRVTYSVTLNGEFIGYTNDKAQLQKQINIYSEAGEDNSTAFVEFSRLPEYSLCLVKKGTETNEDEIFEKIKEYGKTYYKYYTIAEDGKEKYYVENLDEAQEIINKLTEKKSSNIKKISYKQVFGTDKKECTDKDKIITALYKKPRPKYYSSGPYKIASNNIKVDLGISLIKPISSGYKITSRYGPRGRGFHTGLDIAAPYNTPIHAAASGTVSNVQNLNHSYGKYIVINHGNGIQTLYAHCNAIYVSVGDTVSQGQTIGVVGSTGNSTGSHLHLEIRSNGTTLNPQNYLY